MATVYFLGAGASAADGLPVTNELNYGVAAWLRSPRGAGSSLHRYYEELYCVEPSDLQRAADAWDKFLSNRTQRPKGCDRLPNLIETLSILDLTLQEGSSLGVKKTGSERSSELDEKVLSTARMELSMALGCAIDAAMDDHRTPLAHGLVRRLKDDDTVVSANWDTLVERALTYIQRKKEKRRYLQATNIRYCAVNERLVNYGGKDIQERARKVTTILKLHGSLNWFFCPCCGNLYANVEGIWVIDPLARRPIFDECDCGAWLENLTIVPSFIKTYRNIHIRSAWHHAHRALEQANRWVFIGYRLPEDDFHIRALLLRSLRTNLAHNDEGFLRILVVGLETKGEIQKNYDSLFRLVPPQYIDGGLSGWLDHPESRRA
jgi:hypothetical protein